MLHNYQSSAIRCFLFYCCFASLYYSFSCCRIYHTHTCAHTHANTQMAVISISSAQTLFVHAVAVLEVKSFCWYTVNSKSQKGRGETGSLLKVIPWTLHPCEQHKKDHTQKHTQIYQCKHKRCICTYEAVACRKGDRRKEDAHWEVEKQPHCRSYLHLITWNTVLWKHLCREQLCYKLWGGQLTFLFPWQVFILNVRLDIFSFFDYSILVQYLVQHLNT